MRKIENNIKMVAKCGLFCGACPRYLKEKCPGCAENDSARWCKLRLCCLEKKIASCADCEEFSQVMDCRKFNTIMAKIFGFLFKSDREGCIRAIKTNGYDHFVNQMVEKQLMTVKRN